MPTREPRRRIPALPALDGLRALAVTAVLLFHADVRIVSGGFLGVESFFVVSGYLITALLWTEAKSSGRIKVTRFWARRARRLLPGLFAVLLVTTIALVTFYTDMVATTRGEIAAAMAYVSNWHLIFIKQSYFAQAGRGSPFGHLWSLAVEEQFYVLFPVLFGLALFGLKPRSRYVAVLTGLGAVASSIEMAILYKRNDWERVYFGTDTRASGLLLGATLALLWRPWERPDGGRAVTVGGRQLPRHWPDIAAATGIAVLLVAEWKVSLDDAIVFRGGLLLVAIATATVIMATTVPGSLVARVLGGRVITAIGRRSYSIYLWHWPIYVATRPGLDVPWTSGPTLVVRLGLTAVAAELSYRFVELPIRHGALGRLGRTLKHTFAAASSEQRTQLRRRWVTVATATAVALVVLAVAMVRATPPAPLSNVSSAEVNVLDPDAPTAPPGQAAEGSRPGDPATAETTSTTTRAQRPVYAVGDSVMLGAKAELLRAVPGTAVNARIGRQMAEGVDIVHTLAKKNALPKLLLIHLGNNGPVRSSEFENLIATAGSTPIVLVTVNVNRRWEEPNNDVIRSFAKRPNVRIVDWQKVLSGCAGSILEADGTHLRPDGRNCYVAHIVSTVSP